MNVEEFIDTYSDDLITIHESRRASYTHPLRSEYAFSELLDASFSRILAVFTVGGIEAMLESWRDRDTKGVLKAYFAKGVKNGDRVKSLCAAFTHAGIPVDKEVFDDYLAVKYLRNTIIHSGWKEYERTWLEERGFPTDSRKLSEEDFERIERVNQNMVYYIALTGLPTLATNRSAKITKLQEAIKTTVDPGILRISDFGRMLWNNLERIDAYFQKTIQSAVLRPEYDWTEGRTRAEIDGLPRAEQLRLYYSAAARASADGYPSLAQAREFAGDALEFWHEYWQRSVEPYESQFKTALEVFRSPSFDPSQRLWGLVPNLQSEQAQKLIVEIAAPTLSPEKIGSAFRVGKLAYEYIPNVMPLGLFAFRLPSVNPVMSDAYKVELRRACSAFLVNRYWYECVERQARFDESQLDMYV